MYLLMSALMITEVPVVCFGQSQDTSVSEEMSASEDDKTENSGSDLVADASEMTVIKDVVPEGMTPVFADQINEGTYPVEVDSSSGMFKVVECELTVSGGQMTAVMTLSGDGYLQLFMGTGEEAVNSGEDTYIPYEEDEDGAYTYRVPVSALDMGIHCAAFSRRKEKWYDRTLVFKSTSLPVGALKEVDRISAEDIGLKDGVYEVDVTLSGGSGRASVDSPAVLIVKDSEATARIVWSSKNYDYMKVGEEKYDQIDGEENSAFEIPVNGFDYNMPVIADTVAMSQPYEIEYTLNFASDSVKEVK